MGDFETDSCEFCKTCHCDYNYFIFQHFSKKVCQKCKRERQDDFSLITFTQAKTFYLLTDEELDDISILPFISRKNPLKSTWSDMRLYLKIMIESFSIKKWGSIENVQTEIQKRERASMHRKLSKYKKSIIGI